MKPHLRGCRTQEVEEQRSKLWPDREIKYNVNDVSSQNACQVFCFRPHCGLPSGLYPVQTFSSHQVQMFFWKTRKTVFEILLVVMLTL